MNRRQFLQSTTLGLAQLRVPAAWRTFEVTTRVEVLRPDGPTRVWVPAALTIDTPYQRTLDNLFNAGEGRARIVRSQADALAVVVADYRAGVTPQLVVTSRVATRTHAVDLSSPGPSTRLGAGRAPQDDRRTLEHFLRPTRLLPTDGIVKLTVNNITRGAKTDLQKARAIYEWVVENTFRDAKVQGCGVGDIRFMLESKNLGGKCADLNALYVGLARAAGIPARDVYGIRVAKSDLGYASLGAASSNVTRAQHCRAEVYLDGYGWVPVDPADVRKVALEEPPGNRPMTDAMVRTARERLFGAWEMNWMAFNFAHDVALPGSAGAPIAFLMYPQAETSAGRIDSLDPDRFRYEITAREL
jgi:transglutaminase-like putative cysteine protease